MASPPPSSELEYDLSGGDAANEIPLLIADARRTKGLTPAVATVMVTHRQLILSVFDRQIQLIKSRSQALEDGHVTVYDKALLTLSSNGSDLENPSALLFWCERYLGIDHVRAATDTPKFMQEMMAVPTVLNQAIEASTLHRLSGTTIKSERDDTPEPVVFSKKATDPKLKRLFLVYDQARAEYSSLASYDEAKAVKAAKFLRDTAENALSILKGEQVDAEVLSELDATCEMAKEAVVTLSGGKKRKFDAGGGEIVSDTGSMRSREVRGGLSIRGRAGRGRGNSGIPYGYTRAVDSYHP